MRFSKKGRIRQAGNLFLYVRWQQIGVGLSGPYGAIFLRNSNHSTRRFCGKAQRILQAVGNER